MRPPVDVTRKQIEREAREVARLVAKRRQLVKQLDLVEHQLREARRLLRDTIHDAVPPLPIDLDRGAELDTPS